SIVLQIARAYTPAPIARHQRSSTQLTSLLINNAGALGGHARRPGRPLGVAVCCGNRRIAGRRGCVEIWK
ncbi:hypothetical protein, partial [Mycobacterium ulcerans]